MADIFPPNAKPGVKRKQENVATKADKRKYEDKRDLCLQEHWLEKKSMVATHFDNPAAFDILTIRSPRLFFLEAYFRTTLNH